MSEMSPGSALRTIQQAQAGLRKSRQLLRITKADAAAAPKVLKAGWESLAHAHKLLATIPIQAATEPVMTKQLSAQRYATALLVRLRRLARNEPVGDIDDDNDSDSNEDL